MTESQTEGTPWRDFESAPRDGTEILAFRQDAGVFPVVYLPSAECDDIYNPPDEDDYFWFSVAGDDITDDLPTLWMPYPAPPSGADAVSEVA